MASLIGNAPNQVPTNADLGTMAFQDAEAVVVKNLNVTGNATLGDAEATDTHAVKGATTILANSTSAAMTVTQTGTGNAFVVEDSESPDSTPFVVNASGYTVIGNTGTSAGVVSGLLQIQGSGTASAQNIQCYSTSNPPTLEFDRSRGALGLHSIVSAGDRMGRIFFAGSDGTAFIRGVEIVADVDGTPGTNDMPGRLVFSTTADGSATPTERMRIASTGVVTISNTTDASTKDTGAVVIEGGLGVEKTIWASGYCAGIAAKTTAYTATATDHTLLVSGDTTITLPAAASNTGRIYVIKKTDTAGTTVTVDGNASETIDGSTTVTLTAQYQSITIQCDGTNWHII